MKVLKLAGATTIAMMSLCTGTAFAGTLSGQNANHSNSPTLNRPNLVSETQSVRNQVLQWDVAHGVKYSSPATSSSISPDSGITGGGGYQAYYPSPVTNVLGGNLAIEPGDVLVTDDTQAGSGLTGHAAIVIDSEGDTVSIEGQGYHPSYGTVADFFSSHNNQVDIMSAESSSAGLNAGNWANNYVIDCPNAPYSVVNSNLYAVGPLDTTYCSKIPWDAYYYGANESLMYSGVYICQPYDLSNTQQTYIYRAWTGW